MLEEKPDVKNVEEVKTILLLKADFNFANKLMFGSQMVKQALQDNLIQEE